MMKKTILLANLLTSTLLFTNDGLYSQNNPEPIIVTEVEPIYDRESVTDSLVENTVVDTAYYLRKISNIQNHIDAINTKIQYVNSDLEEKALAEKIGWFIEMDQIKKQLLIQKMELEEKIKR